MVVGKSPEWLPPGFIEKVKHKNGRKIKYYLNVANGVKYNSKKEVIRATEGYGVIITPQKENGDENALSIDNKVEDHGVLVTPQKETGDENGLSINNKMSITENGSPAWLPNGWIMEERKRHSGSSEGAVYKVYTELSSGRKLYSKAAVARYLKTLGHADTRTVQNKIDNVDKPNVDEPSVGESPTVMSLQLVSMKNTGDNSNVDNKPNVDAASIDTSLQLVPLTNTSGIKTTKRKSSTFTTVATERMTDDDLPPGWIKEIQISKSGNKMRRDPFYTDPVSGYAFRSKKDAMRFLKTKDIRYCACRPLKRDLNDIKLIENEITSSAPANENKRLCLLGGELNSGEEPSGTKGVAESETKQGHVESDNVKVEENVSRENSEKNSEIINNPPTESSPITDTSTKQHFSERGTQVKSTKSKKRKGGLSLPSRTSKRLAGSQPEIARIVNLSEHSLRAAARSSSSKSPNLTVDKSSESVPLPPSEIEQSKTVAEEAFNCDETQSKTVAEEAFNSDETQSKTVAEEAFNSDETQSKTVAEEAFNGDETQTHQDRFREIVDNLFNDVEEPTNDGPPNPEGEKQIDDSKRTEEPQLCYDFGDSWSDPLEFAFKTLMGEISIDDPLTFPTCFSEQDSGSQKQSQSQSDAPQNEFAESSKQVGPSSSSVSPLGDMGFGSFGVFNCQSSNEAGKKDFQNKFNP